ncbi:hypothetical protein ACFX13_046565 [Malus domestica]
MDYKASLKLKTGGLGFELLVWKPDLWPGEAKMFLGRIRTPPGQPAFSITVIGSADPIRFVVNELELVAAVIDTALKSYACEGRIRQTKRAGYTLLKNKV